MTLDTRDFTRTMNRIERSQVPQATVWALNDTANDVLEHMQTRMEVVFDRPTRFTKNAFMVWRATKRTMMAEVKERPSVGSKHYLKVEETGGARPSTGMERMVASHLAFGAGLGAVVPTRSAKLNSYGNWAPGERNQALAALKSSGGGAGKRAAHFVPSPGSRLSPGIWRRSGSKRAPKIAKVAHFTEAAPVYGKRLGFYDGAETVFDTKIGPNFWRAFEKAMATRK